MKQEFTGFYDRQSRDFNPFFEFHELLGPRTIASFRKIRRDQHPIAIVSACAFPAPPFLVEAKSTLTLICFQILCPLGERPCSSVVVGGTVGMPIDAAACLIGLLQFFRPNIPPDVSGRWQALRLRIVFATFLTKPLRTGNKARDASFIWHPHAGTQTA